MTHEKVQSNDFEQIIHKVKLACDGKQSYFMKQQSHTNQTVQVQRVNFKKFLRTFYPIVEKTYNAASIDFIHKTALLATYVKDIFNEPLRHMLYKSYFSMDIQKSVELLETYKDLLK